MTGLLQEDAARNGRSPASCLVCGTGAVEEFLDLGATPLANRFPTAAELTLPEPRYPLRVGFCHGCGHVQLLDRVPPQAMFDHYLYVSSMSETLTRHLRGLASQILARCPLTPGAELVVDIGSNDGTLLSAFADRGIRALGIDPAANLAALAREKGVETVTAYFGSKTAAELRDRFGPAAAITATNSFPHIPDLGDYVEGIDRLLAPDGVLVIEAHYLLDLLDQMAFDTVYHEHVSYWALHPAMRLFGERGFAVVDVERLPLHHGQLRLWIQRQGKAVARPSVAAQLREEDERGTGAFETYRRFSAGVRRIRQELTGTLGGMKLAGKKIAGYGAPAKGSTLLSYLGLGTGTLDFIADRSPLKQGRYTPGTHIPIVAPERIELDHPDYLLLLAWNFASEIREQLASYSAHGGRFIVPVPEVRIV